MRPSSQTSRRLHGPTSRHHILIDGLTKLTEHPRRQRGGLSSAAIGREADCYWLIDPLDGTKEFINRNDEFTCNLALVEDHRPRLGIVSVMGSSASVDGVSSGPTGGRDSPPDPRSNRDHKGRRFQVTPQRRDPGLYQRDRGQTELVERELLKFLKIAEGLADVYPGWGRPAVGHRAAPRWC